MNSNIANYNYNSHPDTKNKILNLQYNLVKFKLCFPEHDYPFIILDDSNKISTDIIHQELLVNHRNRNVNENNNLICIEDDKIVDSEKITFHFDLIQKILNSFSIESLFRNFKLTNLVDSIQFFISLNLLSLTSIILLVLKRYISINNFFKLIDEDKAKMYLSIIKIMGIVQEEFRDKKCSNNQVLQLFSDLMRIYNECIQIILLLFFNINRNDLEFFIIAFKKYYFKKELENLVGMNFKARYIVEQNDIFLIINMIKLFVISLLNNTVINNIEKIDLLKELIFYNNRIIIVVSAQNSNPYSLLQVSHDMFYFYSKNININVLSKAYNKHVTSNNDLDIFEKIKSDLKNKNNQIDKYYDMNVLISKLSNFSKLFDFDNDLNKIKGENDKNISSENSIKEFLVKLDFSTRNEIEFLQIYIKNLEKNAENLKSISEKTKDQSISKQIVIIKENEYTICHDTNKNNINKNNENENENNISNNNINENKIIQSSTKENRIIKNKVIQNIEDNANIVKLNNDFIQKKRCLPIESIDDKKKCETFIFNFLKSSTVSNIIKDTNFYKFSVKDKAYSHHLIKERYINFINLFKLPKINLNDKNMHISFKLENEKIFNCAFKDELNRNLVSFVEKSHDNKYVPKIYNLKTKMLIQTMTESLTPCKIHNYKDVLNLNDIKDYIIISCLNNSCHVMILNKETKLFELYKEIPDNNRHVLILPNNSLLNNLIILYSGVECIMYELETNRIEEIAKFACSFIESYHPYYDYDINNEFQNVYIIECSLDKVCFYYSNKERALFKTFTITPKSNSYIYKAIVVNHPNMKKLYCSSNDRKIHVFNFEDQSLLKIIDDCRKLITRISFSEILCHDDSKKGDELILNTDNDDTNKITVFYKNKALSITDPIILNSSDYPVSQRPKNNEELNFLMLKE